MDNDDNKTNFIKISCLFSLFTGPLCIAGYIYAFFRDLKSGKISFSDFNLILIGIVIFILLIFGWIWVFKKCKQEYGWFNGNH